METTPPEQEVEIHGDIHEGEQLLGDEAPPGARLFTSLLADIFADRVSARETTGSPTTPDLRLEQIPDESHEAALINLRLLRQLNGHRGSMLRKVVSRESSTLSVHLSRLFVWSEAFSNGVETDISALTIPLPTAISLESVDPEVLYEYLVFAEKNPDLNTEEWESELIGRSRDALRLPANKTKWIDLVAPTFNSHDPKAAFTKLFKGVGFIPSDLTNRKAFEKVPTASLVACVGALRELEGGPFGDEARYERARLLCAIIVGGNLLPLREKGGTITLDASGIFINAGALHAHIPYGLVSDAAIDGLIRDGWMSEGALQEVKLRSVIENNEASLLLKEKTRQLELFTVDINANEGDKGFFSAYTAKGIPGIVELLQSALPYTAGKLVEGGYILPDLVIEAIMSEGREGVSLLARLGEAISEKLTRTKENYEMEIKHGQLNFTAHGLLSLPEEEYAQRSAIVNSSEYYNAHKALRGILASDLGANEGEEFITLRGEYKRVKNGDQHSFVEVLYKGEASRILVNEGKQLNGTLRKKFEQLPLYPREQYEDLERGVVAYKRFQLDIKKLRRTKSMILTQYDDVEFWSAAKDALSFLSGHASPDDFRSASILFDKVEEAVHGENYVTQADLAEEFLALVERSDKVYRKFLFESIGQPVNFTEAFMPEIEKSDVSFGERFATEAREKCVPGGYSETLCATPAHVRVVTLNYRENDPTKTIPYHVEADALNALRLSPRPFLNVMGGARLAEKGELEVMQAMVAGIIDVAHDHKLNVAVPGTQIGIGQLFGESNGIYKGQHGHLPLSKQARLFAVSPGGNTYYPGNPHLTPEFREQTYAMSPVDTIATPFSVDWDAKGLTKYDSLYLNHVAYMEALYDRNSAHNLRAALLLNGGLFSLLEATETYRRGFPLILAEDSGRLAQVLAQYMRARPEKGPNERTSPDELYRMVMFAVEQLPANAAQEFIEKDFGKTAKPENDDYLVFRDYFYRFLKIIEYSRWAEGKSGESQISMVKKADIPSHLNEFYAQEFKGNSHGPHPIPSIKKWESSYYDK